MQITVWTTQQVWHAPMVDLENFMRVLGLFTAHIKTLIAEVVKRCPECRKFVRRPVRPMIKASTSVSFDDRVQGDLFELWDMQFLLLIDERLHWKMAQFLKHKQASTILHVTLNNWIRFFGPMNTLSLTRMARLLQTWLPVFVIGSVFAELSREPRTILTQAFARDTSCW